MSLDKMNQQLATLNEAFYSGVLEVVEDGTRITYNSVSQMKIAKDRLEAEIANYGFASKPRGARLVRVTKGYNR